MLIRLALFLALFFSLSTFPARAQDDVSAASRSVVRVVTVATIAGRIVGHGHGTGFAISPTRVVTNAHVVDLAARFPDNIRIGVVPAEGEGAFAARLIALDEESDLALIEISGGKLLPATLYSGPVLSGTKVSALGYPGNVDEAVQRGLFDQIRPRAPLRSDGNASNVEQVNGASVLTHTAPIARGNSGGPLVDECGRVVGVNTFITRADDGDATFGFAIEASMLARFLTGQKQAVRTVGTACLPVDEAKDKARDQKAAEDAEAQRLRANQAEASAAARETRILSAIEARETQLALAGLLLVLGAMAAGCALLWRLPGTVSNPSYQTWAAWVAGGLAVAAVLAFLTRPPFPARLAETMVPRSSATPSKELASGKKTPAYTCLIDMEASRVTVSQTNDVAITFDGKGCVNGRTQYADMGDGNWQRVRVPDQEDTVIVDDFNPQTGRFVEARFLLTAEKIKEARELRKAVKIKQCSTDSAAVLQLGDTQNAIRAILPESPNEKLVYKCNPAR